MPLDLVTLGRNFSETEKLPSVEAQVKGAKQQNLAKLQCVDFKQTEQRQSLKIDSTVGVLFNSPK